MIKHDDFESWLFLGADASRTVDWEKLRAELKDAPLPLTEKGHVAVLIDFANGKKVTGTRWNQFVGARIQSGGDQLAVALPSGELALLRTKALRGRPS